MMLAYDALFCMTNADRIAYGNDFKQYTSRMVALFVLAWGKRTRRLDLIDEFIGYLSVTQVLFRNMNDRNIIRCRKSIWKDDPETPAKNPDAIKHEIAEALDRIDEGINKWRSAQERTRHVDGTGRNPD